MTQHFAVLVGMTEPSQNGADWFEQSCKKLAQRFPDGMQFVVVMPAFQTLRQQTFDRIVKAKLANATDSGIVIPTIWSAKVSSKNHHTYIGCWHRPCVETCVL